MKQLRIRAVGDRLLPLVGPDGVGLKGRYAGRDKKGGILPEGELVASSSYYIRAILRGDIEEVA